MARQLSKIRPHIKIVVIVMSDPNPVMGDALDTRDQPRTQKCFDPDLLSNGWVEANESLRCYFSDHYGVEAVLRLERVPPSA